VPKHRNATKQAKRIIVIDGCYNKCATKILERVGFKVDKTLNLMLDLKIPKIGRSSPLTTKRKDLKRAVAEIIRICGDKTK
jgi:uncharacterized metal-binding protein